MGVVNLFCGFKLKILSTGFGQVLQAKSYFGQVLRNFKHFFPNLKKNFPKVDG